MGLHVVTPSGLHIDQLDGHYVVSKGKQVDVYKTYGAMVTGLTSGTGEKKPKRTKPAKKARKAKTAASKATKPRKASKAPKKVKAAKSQSTLNKHGHKRGCKCMACSPATRKAAALGREKAARKAKREASSKPKAKAKAKVKKGSKKGDGGGRWSGYNPSTAGRTFGADPDEGRRGPGRPPKAVQYHGDTARFEGRGRRGGNGRTHSSGMTFRMPAKQPIAALSTGYAGFRGSRRGAW